MNSLMIIILNSFLFITTSYGQTKYDVKNIYKAIETESDVKVLTTIGES